MRIILRYMRKSILDALFPKTRQAVLSATLLRPDKWWYLTDLANHLDVTPSSLQRELAALTDAQILTTRKEGNRVYYIANLGCPGIEELQSLFIKTSGIADVLKSGLRSFLADSDIAFIYGSLARGEEIATSDVDLMIVGDLKISEMASALKKIEKSLDREVSITLYSPEEFALKIKSSDAFIKTVLKDKKIFLKGNKLELEKMGG